MIRPLSGWTLLFVFISFQPDLFSWMTHPVARSTPTQTIDASASQRCREASTRELGSHAEVLRCGDLTGNKLLQAIAVLRVGGMRDSKDGIPARRLVIQVQDEPRWRIQLDVGRKITNEAGYVGTQFIDESAKTVGYFVSLSDRMSNGESELDITLYFLNAKGDVEGANLEIAWNPAVRRFQEFAYDKDPPAFQAETDKPRKIGCKAPCR